MKLDDLINQQYDEFYEIGVSHGYEQGYQDALHMAIGIYERANKAKADLIPDKVPFIAPENAVEDEDEQLESELETLESLGKKITRAPHTKYLDFWKSNTEPFKEMLEAGTMSVDEAVVAGKNFGIDKSRIVAKAHKLGFGIKDGEFYRKRVIHE